MRATAAALLLLAACGTESLVTTAPAAAPPARDAAPAGPAVIFRADESVLELVATDDAVYAAVIGGDGPTGERADTIWRLDPRGGPARPIGSAGIVTALAIDGDDVVVASLRRPITDDDADADLVRMSSRDGSTRPLANVRADVVAVGGEHVFVRNRDRVAWMPRDGTAAVETFAGTTMGSALTTVGDDVYYVDLDRSGGVVWRSHEPVVIGPGCCRMLLARDGVLYTELLGTVAAIRDDGVHVLAVMPEAPVVSAHDTMGVTKDAVWWIDDDGAVWAVPRTGGVAARRGTITAGVVGPSLAAADHAVFVTEGTTVLRFDDRPAPVDPTTVEWIPLRVIEPADAARTFDLLDRALGDFADAIRRGDLGLRIRGGGDVVASGAREIAKLLGDHARFAIETDGDGPAHVELSARDVERVFSPAPAPAARPGGSGRRGR